MRRQLFAFLLFREFYFVQRWAPSPLENGVTFDLVKVFAYTAAATEVAMLLWIILLKWLLICRIPDGTMVNLWEPFVRRWQMSYSTLGNYFWTTCPILEGWAGYNLVMRMLGCQIGHRVVGVGPYACIDPDMWHIGNNCCLNHIHPQAHTFEEHRTLTLTLTLIGRHTPLRSTNCSWGTSTSRTTPPLALSRC